MFSEAERIDYARGVYDRRIMADGGSIIPEPQSDAYYRGIFGLPLEDSPRPRRNLKSWGVLLALVLPVSALFYWNQSR